MLLICISINSYAEVCSPKRASNGRIARSATQVKYFKQANPCPSTGKTSGSCPGYIVDHVIPLCNCGLDNPSNMQWQTTKDSKIKDKQERIQCKK